MRGPNGNEKKGKTAFTRGLNAEWVVGPETERDRGRSGAGGAEVLGTCIHSVMKEE
jgi:hypothetical protein